VACAGTGENPTNRPFSGVNAAYGSVIRIRARIPGGKVRLEIADSGAGFLPGSEA
jgi:hypothetical protein